jgi:hypothetical protein
VAVAVGAAVIVTVPAAAAVADCISDAAAAASGAVALAAAVDDCISDAAAVASDAVAAASDAVAALDAVSSSVAVAINVPAAESVSFGGCVAVVVLAFINNFSDGVVSAALDWVPVYKKRIVILIVVYKSRISDYTI